MYVLYRTTKGSEAIEQIAVAEKPGGLRRSATCKARHYAESNNRRPQYATEFHVTTQEDYEKNVVKMVERKNLLSGNTFMERNDTPHYCSPSSEAYWSN